MSVCTFNVSLNCSPRARGETVHTMQQDVAEQKVAARLGKSGACSSSRPAGGKKYKALRDVRVVENPEAPTNTLPDGFFFSVNYTKSLKRGVTEKHQEWPIGKLIFGFNLDNLPNKWGTVNPAKELYDKFKFQNSAHPSCKSQIESFFSGCRAHNRFYYFSDSLTCDETRKKPVLFAGCQ